MKIFFKIFFFLMWNILKVFIEFITTLLLFYVFFFFFLAIRHVGSELPDQGSNSVFEGGVLTTGLLGKAPL